MKKRQSDSDWSVVAMAEKNDRSDRPERAPPGFRAWCSTVGDMRVKDLVHAFIVVLDEYKQSAADLLLWPWAILVFKLAFWSILSIAYVFSVWNLYEDYSSPCRQEQKYLMDVAKAYESLIEGESKVRWEEHPYYVNTPDFVYRYFAVNVACWIGTYMCLRSK